MGDVILEQLASDDKEQFILDNQEAFNYGAMVEFGHRDNHFEEDGQIISRKTIEQSIADGKAYRIIYNNKKVGGIVINVNGKKENWICCLYLQMFIVRELVMLHGVRLKKCILK